MRFSLPSWAVAVQLKIYFPSDNRISLQTCTSASRHNKLSPCLLYNGQSETKHTRGKVFAGTNRQFSLLEGALLLTNFQVYRVVWTAVTAPLELPCKCRKNILVDIPTAYSLSLHVYKIWFD